MDSNFHSIRQWHQDRALELSQQAGTPMPYEKGDTWPVLDAPITGPAPEGFVLSNHWPSPAYPARTHGRYYGRSPAGDYYEFVRLTDEQKAINLGLAQPRPAPKPVREGWLIQPNGSIRVVLPKDGKKFGMEDFHAAGLKPFEHVDFSGGDAWCHEEGLLIGLPYNRVATNILHLDPHRQMVDFVGPVLIIWRKGSKLRQHPRVLCLKLDK